MIIQRIDPTQPYPSWSSETCHALDQQDASAEGNRDLWTEVEQEDEPIVIERGRAA